MFSPHIPVRSTIDEFGGGKPKASKKRLRLNQLKNSCLLLGSAPARFANLTFPRLIFSSFFEAGCTVQEASTSLPARVVVLVLESLEYVHDQRASVGKCAPVFSSIYMYMYM